MTDLAARLQARDTSLWPDGSVAANRLGWVDVASEMAAQADDLSRWAESIDADRIVLIGMGGSSLGPEVLRSGVGSDRLIVLDTTDPATVLSTPLGDTFFLVSSKSGGTLEVRALLAHCWDKVPDGSRYAAITDPGTDLDRLAQERDFARIFRNRADIGGRYSVLSYFGLVPAALLGYDVAELCQQAESIDWAGSVELGQEMAQAAIEGRDKLTIVSPERFSAFGLWVEQLIAESTGKQGKGIVPIPTTEVEQGPDRYIVALEIDDPVELGREFMRWEVATAIAGHRLEIDPFNEPNVTESKENTDRVLDDLPLRSVPTAEAGDISGWLKDQYRPGDYVSIQAYVPYGRADTLESYRRALRDGLGGAPVTAGFGPRFLHSTGQLHKGGPNSVIAVQVVLDHASADLAVPGFGYDFATLIEAQAMGDLNSLEAHGRRVLRVAVNDLGDLT